MAARHFNGDETVYCPARAPLRWAIALMVNTPCDNVGVLGRQGRVLGYLTAHDVLSALHRLRGRGGAQGMRVAHAMQLALQRAGAGACASPTRPAPEPEPPPEPEAEPFELVSLRVHVPEPEPEPDPFAPPYRAEKSPPPPPAPATRRAPSTARPVAEEPLGRAFWLMSGLPWRSSRAEAMCFCLDVLDALVPAEASFAYLYDIGADLLRLVAASGHAAIEPGAHAVDRETPLVRMAWSNAPDPLALDDTRGDNAEAARAAGGIEPRNALVMPMVRDDRLLGLLQLVNRRGAPAFSEDDHSVIAYVGDQLAAFVADSAAPVPPRSAPAAE